MEIFYLYDSYNNLTGIRIYNSGSSSATNYYVTTNVQGDVLGIYNANGDKLAGYEYDAWGNVLSITDANGNPITSETHIANINPFRYRGYYLDSETGLYYLNSRYYNAEVGRFLNADSVVSGTGGEILGYNMFAYCMNNPVNMADDNGNWAKWMEKAAEAISKTVTTVLAFTRELLTNKINDNISKSISKFASNFLHTTTPSTFMNQALAAVGVNGKIHSLTKTPSPSAQLIRNSVKNGIPIVSTIIDFSFQIANGENMLDAGIKSVSHTAIGIGTAKIGMGIGSLIGGPFGVVAGGAIGFVLGTGGQIVFDIIYDEITRS